MKPSYLTVLGALLALALFAGCGKTPSPEKNEKTAKKDAGNILRILCWDNYLPKSVKDLFYEETGIKIVEENFSSQFDLGMMLSCFPGFYDVVQPSSYGVQGLVRDGLLHELDHKLLPGLSNIDPAFLHLPFDPENKYSVPYMAGWTGIVINTDLVKEDIRHYADIFRPEWKGRVTTVKDPREIVSWVLLSQGVSTKTLDPEKLARALPVLEKWLAVTGPSLAMQDSFLLQNGEAAAGGVWSGEAAALIAANPNLRWILPEEETRFFLDCMAISKHTTRFDAASQFLNFLLRPDVSKMISDTYPYMNPNLSARKLLSPKQLANPASYLPPEIFSRLSLTQDYGPMEVELEHIFAEAKDAAFPHPDSVSPSGK